MKNVQGFNEMITVFDLDDTLRTTKQSHEYIPNDVSRTENWLAWQDHVNEHGKPITANCIAYVNLCSSISNVVILTSSQHGTREWLVKNGLPLPDLILERHPNDHSTPFEFKKRYVDENHGYTELWIDDHTEVCDYAESRGVMVVRV